jgi:hypothetical protein
MAMQFDREWVLRVGSVDGVLTLAEGALPWGNDSHAGPELHIEWKRACDELEAARLALAQAYRALEAAQQRTSSRVTHCVLSLHRRCRTHYVGG